MVRKSFMKPLIKLNGKNKPIVILIATTHQARAHIRMGGPF
jgi:hypothetical protein